MRKLTSKLYYDTNPTSEHSAGDVWFGLPTFGVLPESTVSGVIVTPACDLSNRKVETVTFLPIVPLVSYLGSIAFLPEIKRELSQVLRSLSLDVEAEAFLADRFCFPAVDFISQTHKKLDILQSQGKEKVRVDRAMAGVRLVGKEARALGNSEMSDACLLFGKKAFEVLLRKIIRNSFKQDIHFFPSDGQPEDWSAVYEHSVVLFRYALSFPIRILDKAQDMNVVDWSVAVTTLADYSHCANSFSLLRPMKRATLRSPFLQELITRYVGMLVRTGTPDFSSDTVETFISELGVAS